MSQVLTHGFHGCSDDLPRSLASITEVSHCFQNRKCGLWRLHFGVKVTTPVTTIRKTFFSEALTARIVVLFRRFGLFGLGFVYMYVTMVYV